MNKICILLLYFTLSSIAYANDSYVVNIVAFTQDSTNVNEHNSSLPIILKQKDTTPSQISENNYINNLDADKIIFNKHWTIPLSSLKKHHKINLHLDNKDIYAEGTLSISHQRYFEYTIMLNIMRDSKKIALLETRRSRYNQINYIDHPLVGFLIKITKDSY